MSGHPLEPEKIVDTSCGDAPHQDQASASQLTHKPKILILLASFNGADWIHEQITSILSQQSVEVSLVIRDDCSTDQTVKVLRRSTESRRVSFSCAPERSGSASNNFFSLIRENPADGFDFVAFADQDDTWYPDKLERACRHLSSTGSAGYSSAVEAVWDNGRQRTLRPGERSRHFDFLFEGAGQGCTFVLTADLYQRARRFIKTHEQLVQGIVFHDWAFYALTRSWGLSWVFDPKPSMRYRQHGSNSIGARSSLTGFRRRLTLIKSGWYKNQLSLIAQLCVAAAHENPTLRHWLQCLVERDTLYRRTRVAFFCLLRGRRSVVHRTILACSAVMGWI